jgi:hypothetical protein
MPAIRVAGLAAQRETWLRDNPERPARRSKSGERRAQLRREEIQ